MINRHFLARALRVAPALLSRGQYRWCRGFERSQGRSYDLYDHVFTVLRDFYWYASGAEAEQCAREADQQMLDNAY